MSLFKRSRKRAPKIKPYLYELQPEERARLRSWLNSEDTQFALSVLESRRPGLFAGRPSTDNADMHRHIDSVHLSRLKGWEECVLHISGLPEDIKKVTQINEEYQDPTDA